MQSLPYFSFRLLQYGQCLNEFNICLLFRADYLYSMMTAPTYARGVPKQSTGAQRWHLTESSRCAHWQFQKIWAATRVSRTLLRRHTVETCSRNIHSALPKTSLSHLRPWSPIRAHTCQIIATIEHHEGNLLRIVLSREWWNRRQIMEGTHKTSQWLFDESRFL